MPALEELDLLRHLTPEEREELARLMEPVSFAPREEIIEEGRPEDALYVLVSGTVEVHKKVLAGRTRRLAVMQAPTVVGEVGLLAGGAGAVATVRARTRVRGYRLPKAELLRLLDEESPAAFKLVYELGRLLADRMARTDASIAEVINQLERYDPDQTHDFSVFQDRLIQEWGL